MHQLTQKQIATFFFFLMVLCQVKVGQDLSMEKFQISKLNIFDLHVSFHYILKP